MQIARRAYRATRAVVHGHAGLTVSEMQTSSPGSTDFTVSDDSGAAVALEMKAAETGPPFGFTAHGKHDNGKWATLLSQCVASGADALLLTWKPGKAAREWMVIPMQALHTREKRILRTRRLSKTPEQLESIRQWDRGFGAIGCRRLDGAGLRARLLELLGAQ